MDPASQFIVPTIIDVPELIVTNDDLDFDEAHSIGNGRWLNKLQFLATALSYIINLGNIWHFPYLCYKYGGGAFLIAYTLTLVLVGMPLFLMELAFGQYANEGPITIWRMSPAFEGIGYSMCMISTIVAIYYNVINTWTIHYLLASVTFGDLPWSRCDNIWNSAKCFLSPDVPTISPTLNCINSTQSLGASNSSLTTNSISTTMLTPSDQNLGDVQPTISSYANNTGILVPGNCTSSFERVIISSNEVVLPTNEYFHRNVLSLSPSISDFGKFNWDLVVGLSVAWMMVFISILKGYRVVNRFAIPSVVVPYFALLALLVRAITLPGSYAGVAYYFTPNWNLLKDIDIWADATSQIFFSLSPCWGGIITLASVNKFHNNFHSDAMLLVCINFMTCLIAGLVSFSILGYMSNYSGIQIDQVVDKGLGFIFMVFTEALTKLPFSALNSILFFSILLFVGFNSQITVMETVITTIVDTWPHKLRYRKPLILMILCASMFGFSLIMCFGNGFYVVQLLGVIASTITAMVIVILELIAIAWVYGIENFMQDIDDMISVHKNLFPSRTYWYFMWRYLTPSFVFAVLLFYAIDLQPLEYQDNIHPNWTLNLQWFVTGICLIAVPLIALLRFILSPRGSFLDKIAYLCKPSEDWAPSSYVSGPKLINRHLLDDRDLDNSQTIYSSQLTSNTYADQDQDSNDSNEDLKVVNGRANYIIPEEEDDTDTGFVSFITNETNV